MMCQLRFVPCAVVALQPAKGALCDVRTGRFAMWLFVASDERIIVAFPHSSTRIVFPLCRSCFAT